MGIIKLVEKGSTSAMSLLLKFEKDHPSAAPIVYGLFSAFNCALLTIVAKMIPEIPTL
jgi:hypothetical protein